MQELYRFDNTIGYRLGCTCNNHEHVLDIDIDTEEDKVVNVIFKEHICSKTRNFLWRLNAAIFLIFGKDIFMREIVIDETEVDELAQVLNKINVDRMGVLQGSDETAGQPK